MSSAASRAPSRLPRVPSVRSQARERVAVVAVSLSLSVGLTLLLYGLLGLAD